MEANDKDRKIESKVRKREPLSVCRGETRSCLIRSRSPQSSIRRPSKLQVSALAKPGIASLSMKVFLFYPGGSREPWLDSKRNHDASKSSFQGQFARNHVENNLKWNKINQDFTPETQLRGRDMS